MLTALYILTALHRPFINYFRYIYSLYAHYMPRKTY